MLCVPQVYETPVQPGDVILLATDGLFDNVYTKEIVYVLAAEAAEDRDPEVRQALSLALCCAAL